MKTSTDFDKARFMSSLKMVKEFLNKKSNALTMNDMIRKGGVDGGYSNDSKIHLVTVMEKTKISNKFNGRNNLNGLRYYI